MNYYAICWLDLRQGLSLSFEVVGQVRVMNIHATKRATHRIASKTLARDRAITLLAYWKPILAAGPVFQPVVLV